MATRMQQRRGTASQWTSANPILNAGEHGFESDTNKFKIGDGINHWADLAYFVDQDSLNTSLGDYIESSLLGAANGVAQLNSSGKLVSNQIPNIDEITQDAIDSALVGGDGITKTYNDGANTITIDVDITSGDGLKIASNKLTVDDTVVQKRVANVSDTEIGYLDGVTSAIQTQINDKAPSASPTFTGTVTLPSGTVTSTMIADGTIVNADINASAAIALSKLATDPLARANHTGSQAASTISDFTEAAQDAVGGMLGTGLTYNDTANTITVDTTNIQLRVTGVSDTEIGYLDGVTSAIQTQLDNKSTASKTETLTNKTLTSPVINTPTGITKSDVGLANVDNTTDANKPVSTATQTALDLKAPKADPTFTGTVSAANLTLSGDLTVNGTTTNLNSTNLVIEDKNIVLADVATPTNTTADGAGITVNGTTNKTFNWVNSTSSWTSSENLDLVSGKVLKIAGTEVLSSTTLGSGVTGSSLTSVGTIATGTWSATTIATTKGGTGLTGYTAGDIIYASATDTLSKLSAGTNGKLLTMVSGAPAWADAPVSLPTQTGNSGKYLTTDGTTASWATVSSYSAPTLGSTSIASGSTVTSIAGLVKVTTTATVFLDANNYEVNRDLMSIMGAW